MKTKSLAMLVGLLLCFLLITRVQAQEKFRVKLKVSAGNMENQIKSYLSRELRTLGDVIIVDEQADWEIKIIGIEMETKGGYKQGIAFSVLVLRPFRIWRDCPLFTKYRAVWRQVEQILRAEMGREPSKPEIEKAIVSFFESNKILIQGLTSSYDKCTSGLYAIEKAKLLIRVNLQQVCSETIANFDVECLQPSRQAGPLKLVFPGLFP